VIGIAFLIRSNSFAWKEVEVLTAEFSMMWQYLAVFRLVGQNREHRSVRSPHPSAEPVVH
jgi:hypothetical protein